MVETNLEVCRTIAVQYGLPLQFVVKEFHVFDVLGQVTALVGPSGRFVFKGGTALSKVYLGRLQRFSEDLDFDFGTGSVSETLGYCRQIAEKVSGYKITEFRRVHGTVQFYCMYENPAGGHDHVRVDVASKEIMSEKPVVVRPAVSSYAQLSVTGFYVYQLEDLVARKLCALMSRAEGKDFYDVYNALPLCGEMGGAIRKMLASEKLAEEPSDFLEKTILAVKAADYKKLCKLTNPFIPVGNRPKNWLELKNDLAMKLERLLLQLPKCKKKATRP